MSRQRQAEPEAFVNTRDLVMDVWNDALLFSKTTPSQKIECLENLIIFVGAYSLGGELKEELEFLIDIQGAY